MIPSLDGGERKLDSLEGRAKEIYEEHARLPGRVQASAEPNTKANVESRACGHNLQLPLGRSSLGTRRFGL